MSNFLELELIEPMRDFYFTFGWGQKYRNCYTTISARDMFEARNVMSEVYGPKWSMVYYSAEAAGVAQFNLKYIPT